MSAFESIAAASEPTRSQRTASGSGRPACSTVLRTAAPPAAIATTSGKCRLSQTWVLRGTGARYETRSK